MSAAERTAGTYRTGLNDVLHGSALPYGFTLTIFSSGQVLSHDHGTPNVAQALFFAAGAAVAWGLLRFATLGAGGDVSLKLSHSPHPVRAGAIHALAIGSAVGLVGLVALIPSGVVWPLGGFVAVLIYLSLTALEMTLWERFDADREMR